MTPGAMTGLGCMTPWPQLLLVGLSGVMSLCVVPPTQLSSVCSLTLNPPAPPPNAVVGTSPLHQHRVGTSPPIPMRRTARIMIRAVWMGLVCMIPLHFPNPHRPLVFLVSLRGYDRGCAQPQQSSLQVSACHNHTVTIIVLNGLGAAAY